MEMFLSEKLAHDDRHPNHLNEPFSKFQHAPRPLEWVITIYIFMGLSE